MHGVKRLDLIISILAFAVTVVCAIIYGWEATDLIWASWISSLCVGYALSLVSLGSLLHLRGQYKEARTGCAVLILAFFLPLWTFFYLVVLAETLHGMFPLAGEAFHLIAVLRTSARHYWPFLVVSLLSGLSDLGSYWNLAARLSKRGNYPVPLFGPILTLGRMLIFIYLLYFLV